MQQHGDGWRIAKGTPSMVYLTEEELGRLVELYKSGELEGKLHHSLEIFLFLCFSSLHIDDAKIEGVVTAFNSLDY